MNDSAKYDYELKDRDFCEKTSNLSDENFLREVYQNYLKRDPDRIGQQTWQEQLRLGKITREQLVKKTRLSPEYKSLWKNLHDLAENKALNDDDFKRKTANFSNEAFVNEVYRIYLKREPDTSGQNFYLVGLNEGRISRQQVINDLRRSPEFQFLWKFNMKPGDALHKARMLLVQNELPPAKVIVDLGGASEGNIQGALLSMGYPYIPQEITIIDLPAEQRLGKLSQGETKGFTTPKGTRISYMHGSMADLSPIATSSVDMVFSGETIEHVSEADAEKVMQEAYRVLKSEGYFCLDTPNRALTKLHSPDQLTHPEHQKEYLANELINKLVKYKFKIVAAKAICPMPKSLATGSFDWLEIGENIRLGDRVEEGYLFFIKCRKNS